MIRKTEIKKIIYKLFLQDGITPDDAAQQVLDLFDVMKRISELEREYYNLEDDWLKDKSFKKLDRKYEIQKIFSELGISLKDWKKKFNENSKLYISDADTSDSFLTPEEFLIDWEGKDDSTHPNIDIRNEWTKRINQLKIYSKMTVENVLKNYHY